MMTYIRMPPMLVQRGAFCSSSRGRGCHGPSMVRSPGTGLIARAKDSNEVMAPIDAYEGQTWLVHMIQVAG